MPTTLDDIVRTHTSPNISTVPPHHGPGTDPSYTPPSGLNFPSVPPPSPVLPVPPMNVSEVHPYAGPGGIFQSTGPIDRPQARILGVPIQKLGGSTDQFASSLQIPFPWILRWLYLSAPTAAPGGNGDATIDVRICQEAIASAAAITNGIGLLFPEGNPRQIYAPIPITLGPFWLPIPEGHQFIAVRATSLGGATSHLLVCLAGITPLDDIMQE